MGDIAKRLREEAERRDQLRRLDYGDIIDHGAFGLREAANLVEKWEAERAASNRDAYEQGLRTALHIVRELAIVAGQVSDSTQTSMVERDSQLYALSHAAQHIEDAHITHPWQDEEDGR